MLDFLSEENTLPDVVERAAWEGRSGFLADMPAVPLEEFSRKVMMFHGGATEMVPSLEDRGGWQLVLRRSEPRYLNIHQSAINVVDVDQHIHHFMSHNSQHATIAGNASGLARALVDLAGNTTIKEIATGSRADPASISEMVRVVFSLLKAVDVPPGSSLTENSSSAKISAEADQLAEEFLSFPDSVGANPEILSAAEALMERQMENGSEDVDAWAEQLSEILSRFTD